MRPFDFTISRPNFVLPVGVDVKYRLRHLTHVISFQSIALGPSWSYTNMYLDKGIIPSFIDAKSSNALNHLLVSYGV